MGNITKLITDLDAKRAKATQGEWYDVHLAGIVLREGDEPDFTRNHDETEYILALHNAFPTLRQAVLDGERYKAAGEALAKAMAETITLHDGDGEKYWDYSEICDAIIDNRDVALTAYRTATNQNEV